MSAIGVALFVHAFTIMIFYRGVVGAYFDYLINKIFMYYSQKRLVV